MSERVVPVLRPAVLCESITDDRDDRPFALEVPVHTLRWPEWGGDEYVPPSLFLYLQLQDALGTFFLTQVLRWFGSDVELFRTDPIEVTFDGVENRITPLELGIELRGLSFSRPGSYELHVFANHVSLHDPNSRVTIPFPPIRITVLPADDTEGGVL